MPALAGATLKWQSNRVKPELFHAAATRREFLRSLPPLSAALAAAQLHADDPKPAATEKPFRFFQINDLHYLAEDCGRWFRAVIEQMRASEPEAAFCLICGDIADKGDKPSLAAVSSIFGTLGIPIHAVPGNHDFTPEESREAYDAVFPGKLNYHFEHGGWQFIGLDTTMGTKYHETSVADSTLAWLDAELPKLDAKKPSVVFTHFPLAKGVTYTPLNAPAVIERILKLTLVAAFSGHWHGLSEVKAGSTLLATSRCCARVRANADKSPLKGWWVCEARTDGTLTRRFVEFKAPADIPTTDVAAPKPAPKSAPKKPATAPDEPKPSPVPSAQ